VGAERHAPSLIGRRPTIAFRQLAGAECAIPFGDEAVVVTSASRQGPRGQITS
jgi:hypothetical protein